MDDIKFPSNVIVRCEAEPVERPKARKDFVTITVVSEAGMGKTAIATEIAAALARALPDTPVILNDDTGITCLMQNHNERLRGAAKVVKGVEIYSRQLRSTVKL